uniref:SET domain-containing protein n=1 Tax=Panagrolaimus sp. ES5 TaxID=591445 RepID=A0AC34F2X2_9BILA
MKNLQNNPERAKEIYDLYAGDMEQNIEIPFGVIDAARIHQISANNQFAPEPLGERPASFSVKNCLDISHLFILPSYFNHSCLANSQRSFYGDVIVIHAVADIKKGEEICLAYICPMLGFSERKQKLKSWKFTCQCKLCELDSKDEYCSQREKIMEELIKYQKICSPDAFIVKCEPILKKIRDTYADRKEFKTLLAQALIIISPAYFNTGNRTKSVEYLEEVATLMNNSLKYTGTMRSTYVYLGYCYLSLSNISKFKEVIQKAMKMSFCDDMELFAMLYPNTTEFLYLLSL